MKNLSLWAGRHTRLAILLLILCELVNGFNGVLLGATLLDSLPTVWLYMAMTGLILGSGYLHRVAGAQFMDGDYWFTRRCLFVAFFSNFLLFSLLGGVWGQRLQTRHPNASVLGSRRVAMVSDTIAPAPVDSLRRKNSQVTTDKPATAEKQGGQRGAFILLGLLGIIVTYLASGIACSILCSGYGFLALMALYAGLGGLAGTVYFFSRALDKPLKRRRDMTLPERRRDSRRFWLAWLLFIGVFSIIFLIAAR